MDSQNMMVLRHLEDIGSLTALEALEKYRIMRLSARINNLRKKGHDIKKIMVTETNPFGEQKRFARYYLGRP